MKMTEFRSTHPLSDDELASIRANVMSTIAARNSRRWMAFVMRFAIAAAIIVVIGIAVRQGRGMRDEGSRATAVHASPAATATPIANKPAIIQTARVAIPPSASIPPQRPIAHAIYRPKHRPLPHPEYQTIRMEIRTADPDVRIIWIANQKNATTTTGGNS
jgi:hypothetical protein